MKKKDLKQRIVDLEHENIRLKRKIWIDDVGYTKDQLLYQNAALKNEISQFRNLSGWELFKLSFKRK